MIEKTLVTMRHVLGIDAGGTKTRALLADETGRVIAGAHGDGANLRTHGELEVEKVLHSVIETAEAQAGFRAEALALGIAGADRPEDHAVLRDILRRIGFKNRVVVANDARIAFVAGSALRVGLALVCGTGSIAWGRNARGEIARAGGWGWHLGDEGSGFWIGEHAIRDVLRAADGRGPDDSPGKASLRALRDRAARADRSRALRSGLPEAPGGDVRRARRGGRGARRRRGGAASSRRLRRSSCWRRGA